MNPWRWFAAAAALVILGAVVWWLSGIAWLAAVGVAVFGLWLWVAKRREMRRERRG
jgi:membrane protein implicated in regulation of membrane protease activity